MSTALASLTFVCTGLGYRTSFGGFSLEVVGTQLPGGLEIMKHI